MTDPYTVSRLVNIVKQHIGEGNAISEYDLSQQLGRPVKLKELRNG